MARTGSNPLLEGVSAQLCTPLAESVAFFAKVAARSRPVSPTLSAARLPHLETSPPADSGRTQIENQPVNAEASSTLKQLTASMPVNVDWEGDYLGMHVYEVD